MRIDPIDKSSCGRRRSFSEQELDQIKRLYEDSKVPTDRLAALFGCAGGTICYWLDKMGVVRRAPGRALGASSWSLRSDSPKSREPLKIRPRTIAAAQAFCQPTMITFLPDNPTLEAEWRSCLQAVQQERAQV